MPALYVIREDGEYRIVGAGPDGYEGIAGIVLDLVESGNIKDAQWWLDKILDDIKDDSDFGIRAFRGVWSGVTEEGRGQAAIRKAAAVLLAMSGDEKSIQTLEQLRAKETGALERVQLDKAIAESMAKTKKWADLITVARKISTSNTKLFQDAAFRYFIRGAIGFGNWKELDSTAQEKLKTNAAGNPINDDAIRAQMMAKAALGDSAAAAASAKKLLESRTVTSRDHSLVAWTQIASGTVDAGIVDKLKEQIPKVGPRPTASGLQYAIPLVKVLLQKTDEAQQEFVGLLGRSNEARLSPISWITYAWICRQYGFEGEYQSALEKSRSARSEADPDVQWALYLLNKGR
jgi:hypothetical protein